MPETSAEHIDSRPPNANVRESSPKNKAPVPGETFIPIRNAELIRRLADVADLTAEDREHFLKLGGWLEAAFHRHYHQRREALKEAYFHFDPDADTPRVESLSAEQRERCLQSLFDQILTLLDSANYRRLTHSDIERALEATSDWGVNLHVDFDVFQRLEVFARGDMQVRRSTRHWRYFWRPKEIDLPIYQRLAIVLKLRDHPRLEKHADAETVYVRLFKDIPQMDLEMLLPGTRVRISWLDQSRIWVPTMSGLAITVFKIIKGILLLAFAGVWGILAVVGLLGGTIGYGLRSFFGYQRAKDKYQLNLTRSLLRLGLAERLPDGALRATPIPQALDHSVLLE